MLNWFLAFFPILLMIVLMLGFQWGSTKAGPAGWLVAVLIAWARFGAGPQLLGLAHLKALLLALDILLVVWAAFLLYRVTDEGGATRIICSWLPHLSRERGLQALLVGLAFASFLQGIAGFGVPLAITAPLLISLGYSPIVAVAIPSIGCTWAVTFGTLAVAFQTLITASGMPGQVLAPPVGALMTGAAGACGLMVLHLAEGRAGLRRLGLPALAIGLVMGLVQAALASAGLWNIAAFAAGIAGLGAGVWIALRSQGDKQASGEVAPPPGRLALALSGYLILLAFTLLVELVPPLNSALSFAALRTTFPALLTSKGYLTPAEPGRTLFFFRHAGALLTYAAEVTFLLYRRAGIYRPGAVRRILGDTVRSSIPTSVGIASMVGMAVIMTHAGMTETIARGLAQGVGQLFPLLSPWVGALGAFITGSNTNANLIFALLQKRTAELLGFSLPVILAAQTGGGSLGCSIAPTRLVVGANTAGILGQEGIIFRKVLPYSLLLLGGASLIVFLWVILL